MNKEKFYAFLEKNFFYFYFFIEYFNEKRINKKYSKKFYSKCKKNSFLEFDYEILKKNKKSETLFILGSGSSINDISTEMWQHIKDSDSLGFNFWLIHEHIPNYFMFETPLDKETKNIFMHWFKQRVEDFKKYGTFILMKDYKSLAMNCSEISIELQENFMLIPKDTLYGTTRSSVLKSLHIIKKFNLFSRNVVYSRRASLFSAIYFGWRLGYKNIVLAGIDLNNVDYFYESEKYKELLVPQSGQKEVHRTIQSSSTDFRVDELVYMLYEEIIHMTNTKLFVLNPNSLLAQNLPVYNKG